MTIRQVPVKNWKEVVSVFEMQQGAFKLNLSKQYLLDSHKKLFFMSVI